MARHTKIIATIGPATLDFSIFKKLIEAGVDLVRINTSYGNFDQYNKILENIKQSGSNPDVVFDIKDDSKLDFFIKNNLKWLAVSFAEEAARIKKIKERFPSAFVVSKIESVKGVNNFDEILKFSDAIMIARGDLAQAETIERVPVLQKQLSKKTKSAGKYLITATEMLLSMVEKTKPEIAEVSDIANAVFDGSDAIMLSEETAIGKHPLEAVTYMRKTIEEAEKL